MTDITLQMIVISHGSCWEILTENLSMHRIAAKIDAPIFKYWDHYVRSQG